MGPIKSFAAEVAVIIAMMGLVGPAAAQCEPEWQPFDSTTSSLTGADYTVRTTTMWDPDGPGPITPKLVAGGEFTLIGGTLANYIAMLDPETGYWSPLGTGMAGGIVTWVRALAVLSSGDLIAGGIFATVGGKPANHIARWNGGGAGGWSPLGSGLGGVTNASVAALATLPSGDLIVGGYFTAAGGATANHIARWNDSTGEWSPLGAGMGDVSYPGVAALAVLPSGDVVAGGVFTTAGGALVNHIARWSESGGWSPLGSGVGGGSNPWVTALTVLPSGDLIAGGGFMWAGGKEASRIARWNQRVGEWAPMGAGVGGVPTPAVYALTVVPSGDLVVGGHFMLAGGSPANFVARWNASGGWSTLDSGVDKRVYSLAVLPSGDLIAGGFFANAGEAQANYIARWSDGEGKWSSLGSGISSNVRALLAHPSGDLLVGGKFTAVGDISAQRVALWNGKAGAGTWSPLGTGIGGDFSTVYSLAVLPSGDLVVGGDFNILAGGAAAISIARWNGGGGGGGGWSALGLGMGGVTFPIVTTLAVLPSGDLVAGGRFTLAGGVPANHIAGWNGNKWSPLGAGVTGTTSPSLAALAVLPSGDLVAGGKFTSAGDVSANNIARWNGSRWSPLGSGVSGSEDSYVAALAVLPSGDLIAGGYFYAAGGASASHIARWNESVGGWLPLGSGMNSYVYALAVLPSGELVAGGDFGMAGTTQAISVARWDGNPEGWSPLGSGLTGLVGAIAAPSVTALAVLPSGELIAGGGFTHAGGVVAPFIARWGCKPTLCGADCDGSGSLDIDDFVCFQTEYAIGSDKADCDASGELDIDDFMCFQTLYAVGC